VTAPAATEVVAAPVATEAPAQPVKRGPGRPRKAQQVPTAGGTANGSV
jgi:hypothetical protein